MTIQNDPERLFHEARSLSIGGERNAYLKGACGDDFALRAKVDALLAADAQAGPFLAEPAAGPGESAGQQIGRYKLLQQLGEGGFGTVWMAEQREPVKRRVALKVIKLGMDTKQVIARFEAERQALAMMDHPNIAKVLDAGATDAGRPYFVMELVKGVPILDYCDTEKLDTRSRLGLFVAVCHAIQHAHQKGIVHRDIKPSNVLVMLHDGVPVPKVIDFGVAKATSAELTEKTLFTEFGQIIGTPAYMSPEQAGMSGLDIDTRTDIYSLGVLLYELLTGTTPLDIRSLLESGYLEMLRAIREYEPARPSSRVSTLGDTASGKAVQRRTDVKRLGLLLRGDLDWIVMKCLEKDRTRRYETANGLAADVLRHLNDEPVVAGPPSRSYRLRKFVRRNRLQVIAGSVVVLAMLAGLVGTSWGLVEASRARAVRLERRLENELRAASDAARSGRNAAAVAALLDQCEHSLRARDPGKAGIALDAARKQAAEGGAELETERSERLAADLALLLELDAIDQFRWTWTGTRFPAQDAVAVRVRQALGRFWAEPGESSVDEAVARVKASAITERIVAALDRSLRKGDATGARAVLREVDADPYRDAVRDALLAGDRARLAELANRPEALAQPSGFAAFLGSIEAIEAKRRTELLLAAVTRWPGDVDLLMALGQVSYAYPTDPRESEIERKRWFQAALAADGENTAACNDLAGLLVGQGRADEAVPYLRRAIAIAPTHAPAQGNLGQALRALGRTDEAIDSFRSAIELHPTLATVHLALGGTLESQGRLTEAFESFAIAVVCDPSNRDAKALLTLVLAEAGRTDEAISQCHKYIQSDPGDPSGYGIMGTILERAGRADEALAWYRHAAGIDPRNIEALGALCRALVAGGRSDEALVLCRRGVELQPTSAAAHFWLGWAFQGKGDGDEALASFRRTIELDPATPWAHFNVGCHLLKRADALGSDPSEQVRLRREALDMLRAELALLSRQTETGRRGDRVTVRDALRGWPEDPDLAVFREPAALASLPAEDRTACERFWTDVAAVLAKAVVPAPANQAPDAAGPSVASRVVSFLEKAVERQKARLGPGHPDTVQAMHCLANAYSEAGKVAQAVPLFEAVLESVTATFGPRDPNTAAVMNNLGVACWQTGQFDKSVPLFEKLVSHCEAAHGRRHVDTLMAVANLGVNYRDAGRLAEAIPLLDEARKAGRTNPQLGWVTAELHAAYDRAFKDVPSLEDMDFAVKRWTVLVPSLEAEAGADHIWTLTAMNNLGYALARSRRFAEAEAMLKMTIEREVRVLGEGNMLLLQTRTNLGEMYQLQQRHAEAEELLRKCLAERESKEPGSFRLASTRSMLGRVLAERKQFAEAESLLRAGHEGLAANAATTPGWGRYYLPDTLEWLAQLYEDWGKPAEAAKWRSERAALDDQGATPR